MIFNDLRHFISTVDELGQLKVIEGASCELEIGAITEVASFKKSCPAVLFDSINGFPKGFRVLTNFVANRQRERMVFGVSNDLSDPAGERGNQPIVAYGQFPLLQLDHRQVQKTLAQAHHDDAVTQQIQSNAAEKIGAAQLL